MIHCFDLGMNRQFGLFVTWTISQTLIIICIWKPQLIILQGTCGKCHEKFRDEHIAQQNYTRQLQRKFFFSIKFKTSSFKFFNAYKLLCYADINFLVHISYISYHNKLHFTSSPRDHILGIKLGLDVYSRYVRNFQIRSTHLC